MEVPRGHLKGKWYVTDINPPQKKAENVSFCIQFNELFWGISNTSRSACWQKGQQQERSERESKRGPEAHVIDLFFSNSGEEGGLRTGNTFVAFIAGETSIHSSSTRFMTFRRVGTAEIQAQACVLEQREIDTASGIIEVCHKYSEDEWQTFPRPIFSRPL